MDVKDWDGDSLDLQPDYKIGHNREQGDSGLILILAAGTYTTLPTPAARDAAALTSKGDDFDTFTIRVTQGTPTTPSRKMSAFTVPVVPTTGRKPCAAGRNSFGRYKEMLPAALVSGLLNFTDPRRESDDLHRPNSTFQRHRHTRRFEVHVHAVSSPPAMRPRFQRGPMRSISPWWRATVRLSTPVTFSVPILPPNPPNQAPAHGTPSVDTIVNSSGRGIGIIEFY